MAESMGERIARLMKAKNLNQKEFAQAIESTEASVSRYLGNAREPGPKVLVKIANVLGVTVDEILGKEDESDFSTDKAPFGPQFKTFNKRAKERDYNRSSF